MQAPKKLVVLCLTIFALAKAQEQLRADLIESARIQKQETLTPESKPKPERRLESIEHSVPYRLLTGDLDGVGVGLGTVIPGSAFAVLPRYTRTDLLAGRLTLRINALAATNESYAGGLDLAMPSLLNGYGFVDFNVVHRDISEMPYYGPGPNSRKTGRSDYRLNEVDIRALVETGEYSDRRAEDWIVRCLIERRDKIVKTYLSQILPLDRFRVNRDRLEADDLAGQYGFAFAVQWYAFDNSTGAMMPLEGETTLSLPRRARDESRIAYFAARIHNDDSTQAVIVYVRNNSGRMEVMGVGRSS